MLIVFYILAALMIIAALVLILMPMLRRGRQCGRPRGIFGLTLVLAFVLPLSAIGVYALIGTPSAVLASVRKPPPGMTVDQAIAQLKQRLAQSPDDLKGWLILGQSYTVMKQPAAARDAYAHALTLAPDNADVLVAWVEADSMARPDHLIKGSARKRLKKALGIDSHNQRGLWLMGISDYQAGRFVDAALTWRRLEVLLPPDGDVADAVSRQIAMANARAAGKSQAEAQALLKPASAATASATASEATASAPSIAVKVSLSPKLKDKIDGNDILFVYAHAVGGPPMPLAIKRLKASQLPTTVTLTNAMSMAPGHDLSSVNKVALTARVSRSGKATPQPGDLEGDAGPLAVGHGAADSIVINHRL
jgi:cytochrome c-type biogenesis protein CcmH